MDIGIALLVRRRIRTVATPVATAKTTIEVGFLGKNQETVLHVVTDFESILDVLQRGLLLCVPEDSTEAVNCQPPAQGTENGFLAGFW